MLQNSLYFENLFMDFVIYLKFIRYKLCLSYPTSIIIIVYLTSIVAEKLNNANQLLELSE